MRILFVIPAISSFQAFLVELGERLVADGHDVHVAADMALPGERAPLPEGIVHHVLHMPRGMRVAEHLRAAHRLRRLAGTLRPDLVHAHFSAAIFTAALALGRARSGESERPVLIGTFQGLISVSGRGLKQRLLQVTEAYALRCMDASWVLTEDDWVYAKQIAPRAVVKLQRSKGFGCRTDRFTRSAVDTARVEKLRERLGLRQRCFTLLFAGRFSDFKGFALTVRAFLRLHAVQSDCHLILAGVPDSLHPTGLTPEEEVELHTCSAISCVGFVADLQNVLALCDILVLPSDREGMSVCIMEALSMQVPVITLNSRGCRDLVNDGLDGVILPERKVSLLVTTLARLQTEYREGGFRHFVMFPRPDLDRSLYVSEQMGVYCRFYTRV